MNFLERDLEDIIYNTNNNVLHEKGLQILGRKFRQLKIGNYGIADLITIKRPRYIKEGESFHDGHIGKPLITIYELKQTKIDLNTLTQAARYKAGIVDYLDTRGLDYEVDIVLIGRRIAGGDFCYLIDNIFGFDIYTYNYDINGIEFKKDSSRYCLINKGF